MNEIPRYKQLPNACGLSTVLMLLNPEKHDGMKSFLTEFYEQIDFLIPQLSKNPVILDEYKWSVVLNYLLLKILGQNELHEFLKEHVDEFETHVAVKTSSYHNEEASKLKQLPELFSELFFSFFENHLVNPYLLRTSLFSMRTDREIKILFKLFGGTFYAQDQEFPDGTGALYFTEGDFKSKPKEADNKLDILKNHLKKTTNNETFCIAVNLGFHWVAVRSIDGKMVNINDPSSGREKSFKIGKRIPETFRFYLFKFNPEEAIVLQDHIQEFLKSESKKELEQIKSYTKNLVRKADDLKRFALEEIEEELTQKQIVIEEEDKFTIPTNQVQKTIAKPLSGEDLMERIRKRIKESFSDYSKL